MSTTEFHSLSEAKTVIDDFLSRYEDSKKCAEYCDQVKQMKNEFADMDHLFSDVDDSDPEQRYCEFLTMVNSNKTAYSHSNFETVQKTWNYLVEEKKVVYQRERLDLIEEDDFKPYLVESAIASASRRKPGFRVNGYYLLDDQVTISLEENGGKLSKKGSCTIGVEMIGNCFSNWGFIDNFRRTAYLEIVAEGCIKVSEHNCYGSFSKGHVEVVQESNNYPWGDKVEFHFHVF